MAESSVSLEPKFFLPKWARIAYACFMFLVAGLCLWKKEFLRFEWVTFVCLGLYQLVYIPKQKWETPRTYIIKPRTIISSALIIAAGCTALHLIYLKLFAN